MVNQMPNIAVYAIAKNEADHVYRWYNSVKEADHIIVLDTGSTDSTVAKLNKYANVTVEEVSLQPFRFDVARQMALNLVPDGCFALYIDLDEVMSDGWYDKLQAVLSANKFADAVNIQLIFEKEGDKPVVSYNRMALHDPKKFVWRYPVHEVLQATQEVIVVDSDVEVHHLPDNMKERDYLPLLYIGAMEQDDGRANMYLGRELVYLQRWAEAIPYILRAIERETSNYSTSEAYNWLGQCYEATGQSTEARLAYIYAAWSAPDARESWAPSVTYFWRTGDVWASLSALHQMLLVENMPKQGLIRNESYYREWPYHMLAVIHHRLGNTELAIENIDKAYQLAPQNHALIQDLVLIRNITISVN